MGIFGNIMDKIFHHQSAAPQPAPAEATPDAAAPEAATPEPSAAPQNVDVGAVLSEMASMKGDGGGNYQTSIVDLLKLLDLDSSLSARKQLADELDVSGEDGSAEKNIALHQAVMAKLAENGGVVPDSLRN